MSLRLRLCLLLAGAFIVIWALAATWMFRDLRSQMMFSLDQRLVASARMVAGLMQQLPEPLPAQGEGTLFKADQATLPDGMACQVSSLRGEILARSHSAPEQTLNDQRSGFSDQVIDGERWRSFTLQHGAARITTADRHLEREALNRSVLTAASVPVLVALAGTLGVLWLLVGKGLAPLNRMRDALRRRDADSLEPLQISPLPSELQPLLDTQNQLFARIGSTLERERRLTGDAAHELRSPLTAIKTHLQVARMTQGESRELALEQAERGADRLHRTLEQLLLLARVEGSLSFDDGISCSAEQVARMAIQDASHGGRERIETIVAGGCSPSALDMPSVLAVAALRNLLDNALRHGAADSPILLHVGTCGSLAYFEVQDQGPGIAAADLEHLTERFWRSPSSKGCGLGLAIVQAIVQRCHGHLEFPATEGGLRVRLQVPLQPDGAHQM